MSEIDREVSANEVKVMKCLHNKTYHRQHVHGTDVHAAAVHHGKVRFDQLKKACKCARTVASIVRFLDNKKLPQLSIRFSLSKSQVT